MSGMIQIRHVPDDIHKILKIRAIENGMSLSNYLLREVTKLANRPTLDDLLANIEKSSPAIEIKESSADAVHAEREAR